MLPALTAKAEYVDPRVRRTRQMLERALETLLAQRPFERISVGDIAEAATLNRATFYAHFADKFDLLEAMAAARFEELLLRRGIVFDGTCPSALYRIVLAVCDFLVDIPYCLEQRQVAQHLEQAMVSIVRARIDAGLAEETGAGGAASAMVAAAAAGAMYGAAKQWFGTPNRPDAEQAASAIAALLAPMMAAR